jgi:hypothetical protein
MMKATIGTPRGTVDVGDRKISEPGTAVAVWPVVSWKEWAAVWAR